MIPYTQDSYDLMHQGAIALARVECNGMKVDLAYLDRAIKRTQRRIERMRRKLKRSEVCKVWRKAYGDKMNLDSPTQLAFVLFEKMGFVSGLQTHRGKNKVDEEALGTINHPFITDYLALKKLQKALGTNLKGIRREVVDGLIKPFFNLHLARTYRSSSDSFNFQNLPIRDEEISQLVRRVFIARPGHRLVELDISGVEICVATCYHKDPKMIQYIEDPTKDLHRDMAMECYMLAQKQMTKAIRYCGKNKFVFPQFYGDWYIDCAKSLWNSIPRMNLVTKDGIELSDHLRAKGITKLGALDPEEKPRPGTFERHIMEVEHDFWDRRFKVYKAWKDSWYKAYRRRGEFIMKTGFVCRGFMKRNEVINYPVQGSAFHCLLWVLIRLVLHELIKRNMKTLIVGQIHDSIVADVPEEELDDFLVLVRHVFSVLLPRHWKWLIVPITIEAEVAPAGGSWADKEEYKIPT